MKKHIPNSLTLLNLFAGCGALLCILNGYFSEGLVLLAVSGVADLLDGAVARLLKVNSPLGVQLDSLADMVSFGVVPGAILFKLLSFSALSPFDPYDSQTLFAMLGFVVTLFSALRLAKFNIDERQTTGFIGLATPSCTLFMAGLLLIYQLDSLGLRAVVVQPVFLYSMVAVFSYLLVSEIPMFSFKGKFDTLKMSFLGLSLIFVFVFKGAALAAIVVLYILLNIAQNIISKPEKTI
jgi:CDP-diacylglycerol---serine O-phosphatidyltransferase